MKREYDGPDLDLTWQDFKDRPYKGEGETVGGTTGEHPGSEQVEGVDAALGDLRVRKLFEDIDEWVSEMRNWDFGWRQQLLDNKSLPRLIRICILTSLMNDMIEYNARVDLDNWIDRTHEIRVDYIRVHGITPFSKRQYVGDPALHSKYAEYITEVLPEQAPNPLNDPGIER